jgi:hypothetical protein
MTCKRQTRKVEMGEQAHTMHPSLLLSSSPPHQSHLVLVVRRFHGRVLVLKVDDQHARRAGLLRIPHFLRELARRGVGVHRAPVYEHDRVVGAHRRPRRVLHPEGRVRLGEGLAGIPAIGRAPIVVAVVPVHVHEAAPVFRCVSSVGGGRCWLALRSSRVPVKERGRCPRVCGRGGRLPTCDGRTVRRRRCSHWSQWTMHALQRGCMRRVRPRRLGRPGG